MSESEHGGAQVGEVELADEDERVYEEEPDLSVLKDNRLVCYIWFREGPGTLALANHGDPHATLDGADIVLFQGAAAEDLKTACDPRAELEQVRFRLGIQGYDVQQGWVQPAAHLRRF